MNRKNVELFESLQDIITEKENRIAELETIIDRQEGTIADLEVLHDKQKADTAVLENLINNLGDDINNLNEQLSFFYKDEDIK